MAIQNKCVQASRETEPISFVHAICWSSEKLCHNQEKLIMPDEFHNPELSSCETATKKKSHLIDD